MPLKPQTITVVLADDQAVVLRGLSEFLATAQDIEVVAMAGTGQQAIDCAEKHVPDVLLLDLRMPDLPPVLTVREIKSLSPRTQIIGLTSHECSEYVEPASRAGVIAYLLKNIGPENLVTAVRKAAAGEATISPNMAKSFLRFLGQGDQSIADAVRLSAFEIKVLWLISEAKSTELIANNLGISVKTVKSNIKNILEKFYLNDREEASFVWRDKMTP
jgi:NarL family two-component system response regulator LiaR